MIQTQKLEGRSPYYISSHALQRFKERVATHLDDAASDMDFLVQNAAPGNPYTSIQNESGKLYLHSKAESCVFVCEDRGWGIVVVTVRKPEVEGKIYTNYKKPISLSPTFCNDTESKVLSEDPDGWITKTNKDKSEFIIGIAPYWIGDNESIKAWYEARLKRLREIKEDGMTGKELRKALDHAKFALKQIKKNTETNEGLRLQETK